MIGNANGLDLNNDSLQKLSRMGGLGMVLARRIVDNRPFRRWDDLKTIEGFDVDLVEDLRGSGAKLGRTTMSTASKSPAQPRTWIRKRARQTARGGVDHKQAARKERSPNKLARNIFSGKGMQRD